MAGYKDSEPRDKSGRWTDVAGAATKFGRKLGILSTPRSHKAGMGRTTKVGRPRTHLSTGDAHTDAQLKRAAVGIGVKAAGAAAGIALGHAARKLGGDAAASVAHNNRTVGGSDPYDPSWPILGTPQKIPNSVTHVNDKTYKIRLEFGTVNKTKRPTFPGGYNTKKKQGLLDV